MTEEIKPALTAQEWGKVFGPRGDADFIIRRGSDDAFGRIDLWTHGVGPEQDARIATGEIGIRDIPHPEDVARTRVVAVIGRVSQVVTVGGPAELHALAALALYGQPYGFRHEHASAVLACVDALDPAVWPNHTALMQEVADRIAALLPPRDTT